MQRLIFNDESTGNYSNNLRVFLYQKRKKKEICYLKVHLFLFEYIFIRRVFNAINYVLNTYFKLIWVTFFNRTLRRVFLFKWIWEICKMIFLNECTLYIDLCIFKGIFLKINFPVDRMWI